jgi:hypothetical protein
MRTFFLTWAVHFTPSIFVAHLAHGTWRKLAWHWTTCCASLSVSNYSAYMWCKTEVSSCRRGMIWSQQLLSLSHCPLPLSPLPRWSTCRSTELQFEYEFTCDGQSHNFFIGVDLVGHSKYHLILYLNILPIQKPLYTEAYFKITSHIILHMDDLDGRQCYNRHCSTLPCQSPHILVQCTEVTIMFCYGNDDDDNGNNHLA